MAIILDIIIIAILALSIYLGYRKGLVNAIFKIITFFLAIIISFVIYIPVTNFIIDNTRVDDNIKTFIIENFSSEEKDEIEAEKMNTSQVVEKHIKKYTDDVKNAGMEKVAEEVSIIIVKIAVFVVIFTVARLALFFVKLFANIITSLPLIKEFNKTGGFIYGVARGFIIIWVILAAVSIILPMTNDTLVGPAIEKSYVTKILYDYNILLMILF